MHDTYSNTILLDRFAVTLQADDRRVIDAVAGIIDEDLTGRTVAPAPQRPSQLVQIHLSTDQRFAVSDLPPSKQATSTFENMELFERDDSLIVAVDRRSTVTVDASKSVARGFVAPEHLDDPWVVAHRLFYVPLLEILRHHRAYYVHAGCVCEGDQGILLCGDSGQGKSTLTYALARSRFSYLSDDGVFMQENPGGIEVFSFPERIKLDANSCSFFDEFGHLPYVSAKRELKVSDTRIRQSTARAKPVALIFPRKSNASKSRIRDITKSEAMMGLVRQSISMTSPAHVQEQLDLLGELVEDARCFVLDAARDFEDIPDLVANAALN